jgi:sacsin
MKNVECGIAGLVSSTPITVYPDITFPQITQPRIISTLPLPIPSDVPVYIHASFSLSGDRKSLIIDEHGLESHRSRWNRYLLKSAIPDLYLSFLDDIGRQVREEVFNFWPQKEPPERSCSELICCSFWEKLPQSSGRFFPKDGRLSNPGQRQSPKLFEIRQAMFDFLPKTLSDDLAPLLLSLGVNLVGTPSSFPLPF